MLTEVELISVLATVDAYVVGGILLAIVASAAAGAFLYSLYPRRAACSACALGAERGRRD